MSIALLELAAARLGLLLDDVAFLGGASLVLWVDDTGAPDPRVTMDVDVIVLADSRIDYYRLSEQLRQQGFSEDVRDGVICRCHGELILDVMPTDETILGFTNRWYPAALVAAEIMTLPSGKQIRAVTPPYLLATKIEAFRGRGRDDYLASVDFEDLVRLVDGRERLVVEVEAAPSAPLRWTSDSKRVSVPDSFPTLQVRRDATSYSSACARCLASAESHAENRGLAPRTDSRRVTSERGYWARASKPIRR